MTLVTYQTRAGGAKLVSPALQRWEHVSQHEGVLEGRRNMGHTYATNFVHCVFSTKNRQALIENARSHGLYAYFGGIANGEGFRLIRAGGTKNHVHLLIALPATCTLAHAVQKLKGSSSHWMGPGFSWQQGYGAFSVSPSQVEVVTKYIQRQKQHHQKRSFEDEFLALLRSCGVSYDPQFVFG